MTAQRVVGDATAVRQVHREIKYRVGEDEAAHLERIFAQKLPLRPRFTGRRDSMVRSVYLDYPDRSLTAQSLATPDFSQKVRYKRYGIPERTGVTVDAHVFVWIEVKVRIGNLVTKERVPFPGPLVGELLARHRPPPEEAHALGEILAKDGLAPVVGVRYRRVAFEAPDESLRITIDREVSFQRVSTPGTPTPDVGRLEGAIVEIKPRHRIPTWFEAAIHGRRPAPISKFEAAIHALRGP